MPLLDSQRISGPPPSNQKAPGSIHVIGSAVRDTRRQPSEFRDSVEREPYAAVLSYFVMILIFNAQQFLLN